MTDHRSLPLLALALLPALGCHASISEAEGSGQGRPRSSAGLGGSGTAGGGSGPSGSAGDGTDATSGSGGAPVSRPDGGISLPADSPCSAPALADVSRPTSVVGKGTPESCTDLAFGTAVAAGGIITFDCGKDPFTLILTTEKVITRDTVIDGDGRITLSGGQETRIFAIRSGDDRQGPSLTLQNLALVDGLATEADAGGAAVFRRGGRLVVIGCDFLGNRGAREGVGVAGGAIASIGGGETIIARSSFTRNLASNGGALSSQDAGLVLVETVLTENEATGGDVQPSRGGHGGAVFMTGARDALSVCNSRFTRNRASANGGAIYRWGNGLSPVKIDRSTVDENYAVPEGSSGWGGGAYLQGALVEITRSTVSNNTSTSAGGLHLPGPGPAGLTVVNTTFAGNRAIGGPGGGLMLGAGVRASLLNVTVAHNEAPPVLGGGAGVFAETADVRLTNTIVASNRLTEERGPSNCVGKMMSGGGNLQYPVTPPGSGEAGSGLCADGVAVDDPALDELGDNGGPTLTVAVPADSPAVGIASGCPPTDQRGQPRKMPCTAGAFERN
jgi:hypothetical protein